MQRDKRLLTVTGIVYWVSVQPILLYCDWVPSVVPEDKRKKCDALLDLVPFVQFKKSEKHAWRSVTFGKVTDKK